MLQRIRGESDQDKLEILHSRLHKEVYLNFISAVMVLLEEVRHLARFAKSPQQHIIDEAQNFERDMQILRTKLSQLFDIEIQYVPLFDNYKNYPNIDIKAVDEPHSLLYKNIKLERNTIQEIVSYGMKSPYVNEPTKVILAQ
jgi:hypothetical protein